jgi:hypothetical protein
MALPIYTVLDEDAKIAPIEGLVKGYRTEEKPSFQLAPFAR